MVLRRKIRWLTLIGLVGCLTAAILAYVLLQQGLFLFALFVAAVVALAWPVSGFVAEHLARQIAHDERLSGIMRNVDEAIVLVAEDGAVEEHNPAAETLFGRPAAELGGVPFAVLFAEADRPRVSALFSACVESGVSVREEALGIVRAGAPVEVSLAVSRLDVHGKRSVIGVLADITARLQHERELLRLATRDRLTGLPNRALIESLMENAVERARRNGTRFGVLCLDLSRFKLITDTLGHQTGERLLKEVAVRIQDTVRGAEAVGRIGADDFAVLLEAVPEPEEAAAVAQRVLAAFDAPVDLDGVEHYVRPSIGIALFPEHADDAAELMRAADTALYAAKRQGGKRHAFFRREMAAQARHHLALDRDLRAALAAGEFRLVYQPKVSLVDFALEGFEALLRWERPGQGLVPPGEFIPVAEESGFIVPLGDWVLDEACRQQRAWQDRGLQPVPVAVNISPRQLRQRTAEDFRRTIDRHGLALGLIEIEITEGAVMQDLDHALAVLGDLKAMGVRVAVDDFGTGHSSLSYLKRLPLSTLKIDRSFIDGVPTAREDSGIVSTIIAMADMLGLHVVAEGVERSEQASFLRHHNCLTVQGWLTGRPVPPAEAADLLAQRLKRSA